MPPETPGMENPSDPRKGLTGKPCFLAVLLFLSLTPGFPLAQETQRAASLPGSHLITMCKGLYDVDYGYCTGYLKAVSELMIGQPLYGLSACNHGLVPVPNLIEHMKIQIEKDPALSQLPAGELMAQVMARTFPCGG